MLRKKLIARTVIILSLLIDQLAFAQGSFSVERPPQFVLLAFDGSYENKFWEESRQFAKDLRQKDSIDIKFTYFISGVYWLSEKNYALYMPPHKEVQYSNQDEKRAEVDRRLKEAADETIPESVRKRMRGQFSDIGFGTAEDDIAERIDQVNMAYEEGHEIASHANGHYKGGSRDAESRRWSLDQWRSEFQQFIDLIFNVFENNKMPNTSKYASGYAFSRHEIIGFRAPTLDTNPEMFQALSDFNFKYDTSGASSGPEDGAIWPKKNKLGTWVFPLGYIKIVGTNRKTASMDYNFYANQSRGIDDKANKDFYREQMLSSYLEYFNSNYYGNRAPIHIGHHFSKWNGGAYWEAMKSFASQVCGKPEVRCVTYAEYVKWLESQGQNRLASLRAGSFSRMERPPSLKSHALIGNTQVRLERAGDVFRGQFKLDRLAKALKYRTAVKINNVIHEASDIDLQSLRNSPLKGSDVVISAVVLNYKGFEVDSFSLKIEELGTQRESIGKKSIEERAALGDLPEAHTHHAID
jgi:hypothetical protein